MCPRRGVNHTLIIGFCPLRARVNCKRERRDNGRWLRAKKGAVRLASAPNMVEDDEPSRRDLNHGENGPAKTTFSRLWKATLVSFIAGVMILWGAFLVRLLIKLVGWIAAII
jgi:hypothetical protein